MSTSRRSTTTTTTTAGVAPADAPAADVPEWTVEMHGLTREASWELLAGGTELVGRIGLVSEDGPLILPVNFAVVDRSIVIRTAFGTLIDTTPTLDRVSFEVDHTDAERMTAWSVLVLGRAW